MPVNNALTPEGQNSLGAAFGYFPQLRRNRTVQDPRLAAEMPLQFLRGRTAATLGAPSDILNFLRSPLPMEVTGDVDYAQQAQLPYGSQELLRTLPLPPQGPAQAAAGNVGAVVPLTPTEALAAARAARQAAFATGRAVGPAAERMAADYLQRQGLMAGVLPSPKSLTMPSVPTVEQMKQHGRAEVVPLSQAVSFQTARNWDKFKAGKGPGDLVQGFGDKPLALRLETGEYVIYDGNHRTDLALQQGKTALPMHVIDVKSYDPAHAGRKPVPSKISDDELLSLLGADTPKFQYPQEEALRLAQQRAALPVEQYGLGLPAGNTAEQRLNIMFPDDVYHGSKTPENIRKLVPGGESGSIRTGDAYGTGVYTTTDAAGDASAYGAGGAVFPLRINRSGHLKIDAPNANDLEKLSKFAGESMLPSDKARFAVGREKREFKNVQDARDFFANQRENWNQFGGGYDRARPEALANPNGTFAVEFTNFDAPVPITSGKDADTLLRATGYDNVQSLGYTGHTLDRGAGRLWDVTTDTDQLRSRFAAGDPFRRTAAIAATMGVAAPDLLAAQADQDAYSKNELRKFKRQSAR